MATFTVYGGLFYGFIDLYGGLFYGFIVCGKVRVKHPGYKIIGFVNTEL
ncbi:hypothetical protein LTSEBAI_1273 [Salmonella enterica subsp. enterica serovar Baildon str. R6-199]|nr:hypothetical protein LTSEBAI_1273 [Salmonella enterica subsp. enterica serovar Baildon str. R6-199]